MPDARHALATDLAAAAAPLGFDLAQPFAACRYNDAVAADLRLPDFGRRRALGVLLGNTRALWPVFRAAWNADAALRAADDPLDRYTETRLTALVDALGVRAALRCAHDAPPRRVAIQRLAELSGLAAVSPAGLCVHPVYGPWIALRAAVVFDVEAGPAQPPAAALPCDACAHACRPAVARAGAAPGDWRAWLAARDACPLGRAHRYDERQIAYHYTKARDLLRGA